jgi:DNA replication protein DnaC
MTEALSKVLPVRLEATPAVCATHGAYSAKGVRFRDGREVRDSCPKCQADAAQAERAAEKAERERRQVAALEAQLGATGVPARFLGRGFDGFKATTPEQLHALTVCRDFAEDFEAHRRRGSVLILSGRPGTGKTHLATAMLRQILPANVGLYLTAMGLIRAVRDTWRRDSARSESEVLDSLAKVPLLVLDEVGMQYGTDGEATVLFDVLDRRYRDMQPSVLLTNSDREGLRKCLGDRLADRLRETARLVPFEWDSYRAQARKEAAP